MITVNVLINGEAIMARSAVNKGTCKKHVNCMLYKVDDGNTIHHNTSKGVTDLAMKLLSLIQESQ